MIWLLLLFLPILITVICLFTLHVEIFYRMNLSDTHRVSLRISIFRMTCWKRTIYLPTLESFLKTDTTLATGLDWKELAPLLRQIHVKYLHWETGVGTGEADVTGKISGIIWTGKEISIRLLERRVKKLSPPQLTVKPNYYGEGFYSRFDCICKIPIPILFRLRTLSKTAKPQ